MSVLVESNRTQKEISKSVGPSMLDYHLQMLQQAGLVEIKDGSVTLADVVGQIQPGPFPARMIQ
jgi:DNA-binding IscR family transcriptional regulator